MTQACKISHYLRRNTGTNAIIFRNRLAFDDDGHNFRFEVTGLLCRFCFLKRTSGKLVQRCTVLIVTNEPYESSVQTKKQSHTLKRRSQTYLPCSSDNPQQSG